MVLIGNTRLDIFSNDTTDDIISRIADSLGTLPEYLKVDLPDKNMTHLRKLLYNMQ